MCSAREPAERAYRLSTGRSAKNFQNFLLKNIIDNVRLFYHFTVIWIKQLMKHSFLKIKISISYIKIFLTHKLVSSHVV